jgi:hypothetical protein
LWELKSTVTSVARHLYNHHKGCFNQRATMLALFSIHLFLLTVGLPHGHKCSAHNSTDIRDQAGVEHTGCSPEQLISINAAQDYVTKACTTAATDALHGSKLRYHAPLPSTQHGLVDGTSRFFEWFKTADERTRELVSARFSRAAESARVDSTTYWCSQSLWAEAVQNAIAEVTLERYY